jgi:hypothetical protein
MKVFSIEGLEHDSPLSLVPIVHLEDQCNNRWVCVSGSPAGKFLALEHQSNTRIWYFNDWETFDFAPKKYQN